VPDELVETVEHFEPNNSRQLALYGQGMTQVQILDDNRELRLLENYQGVPFILWVILAGGGALTIAFGFLVGMKALWLHRLSITSLTVLIVLILYTIHLIEYPFTSDVKVTPAPFESVSDRLESGANT
jgi:ABC-type branched-subunit amino acid transport system permease subunit